MLKLAMVGLVAAGVGGLVPTSAMAQPKELKFANFITNSITYTGVLRQWTDDVNAALAGKYQVKGYYGGTLGRDPSQYSKIVRDGVAEIAFVTFGKSASVFPDTTVFEVPFAVASSTEGSLTHWRLHKATQLTGYEDFHFLALVTNPPYQFHFNKPVTDLASLANRKVRSGGRIQTQIVEALGMTPVSGPITSSAESLNRGTWDGIFLEWSAGGVFGVHKVAKHHYDLRLSSVALGIAMNKKAYESLDPESRKAIDDLSGERLSRMLGTLFDGDSQKTIDEVKAEKDTTIVMPSTADVAKARQAMEPIRKEWLAANPRNAQILDTANRIAADVRSGK